MKLIVKSLALLLMSVAVLPAFAQEMPSLPADPDVRIGKLENGLTYYIRHNEYPKGQADFYIAQKVGSVLEDDNQRGLAHFLEHMCFNGTKHFPGNAIVEWCESVGIKFGANLNAYTSVDQTVYNISNVAVTRTGIADSCLLILHDWANDLLLEDEEIDKERGVIHEEWRRSMSGAMRIYENILPIMYPGSPYGHRLPIGTMDVVDNFPYQALRDYYEKWYRPDQQGIIVVGDIDVNHIEKTIKSMFADIEMPADAAERVYFPVPDTEGTIVAVGHDKEMQGNRADISFKLDGLPREMHNTMAFYMQNYITYMIEHMLQARLDEINAKADAPFAAAGVNYGNYMLAKTKDALSLIAIAKDSNVATPLAAVYREFVRAAKSGFTQSEYERAKSEYLSQVEKRYNNRETRENNVFVQAYVNNFLDNDPIPAIDIEKQIDDQLAAMIPLDAINQTIAQIYQETKINNRVLTAMLSDNEAGIYPTEAELLEAINGVDSENIVAFVDNTKTEPLIAKLPKKGKITKTNTLGAFGATEWILSNGSRVIAKKTNFKEDEILFMASETGKGTAYLAPEYDNTVSVLDLVLSQIMGYGNYTSNDMSKYLQGKQASLSLSFDEYEGKMVGSSTPKDLKYLMEMIYMGFTNPNIDAEEFQAFQSTYAGLLHNQENNPQYQFSKFVSKTLYPSGRKVNMSAESIASASRDQILSILNQMTDNAADYTFTFVGNFDESKLRAYVEQYIASIPGKAKTAVHGVKEYVPAFNIAGGTATDRDSVAMETPQLWVFIAEWAELPYSSENSKMISALGQILSQRLIKSVREREGATYSIGAQGTMSRVGDQNTLMQIAFPMKPEKEQLVLDIIADEFKAMEGNITEEEVSTVREYMIKDLTEGLEKNGNWLSYINGWSVNGINNMENAKQIWLDMTPAKLQDMMKLINGQNNYRVMLLSPKDN